MRRGEHSIFSARRLCGVQQRTPFGACATSMQDSLTGGWCKCCQSGYTVGVNECGALAYCRLVSSSDEQANAWVIARVNERVQSVHAITGTTCLFAHETRVRSARAPSNSFARASVHATRFAARSRNSNSVLYKPVAVATRNCCDCFRQSSAVTA